LVAAVETAAGVAVSAFAVAAKALVDFYPMAFEL